MLSNNRTMKINPKLRRDLNTYKLDYPTDRRTKEYNAQIERFKAPELYKLFLQSKVEYAKLKQKETNKQEKKEATKKARAEAKQTKQRNKNLKINRYIGSVYTTIFVVFKLKAGEKKGEERTAHISKTHIVDVKVNEEELENALLYIIDEYIEEVRIESDVETADLVNRKDSIQIVNNNKIKQLDKIRMKDSGAGLYDGYAQQEWDTNSGRCVFDYIIYRYGNIDGFKKISNYESLCKIFNNYEDDEDITDDNDDVITD